MENGEILVEETENADELTAEEDVQEDTEIVEEETQEESSEDEPVEEEEEKFTREEVNNIVARRQARIENKIRKEYERKYGRLEDVVTTGLGAESVEDATSKLEEFYTKKGINIPMKPKYSDKDIELLANAEADEIISSGYEDVRDEVERLASKGIDNMDKSEKIIFKKLADERKKIEDEKDLASIGISRKALEDKDFQEFNQKLNPSLSLKERYEMYQQTKPKKENKKMGSMKGTKENKAKDYYSPEEIALLSDEDLDNEQVWEAVRRSMTRQS